MILQNSTRNKFLNPVTPASTSPGAEKTRDYFAPPSAVGAEYLGNVGQLAGVGLTVGLSQSKPPKPISIEPVRAIAQKAITAFQKTRTPPAGRSRAF